MPDELTSLSLTTTSPQDTRAAAAAIAGVLQAGDAVALSGDLGAGKTCFVQGAAGALGVALTVTSPTFVLVKHLPAPVPVIHADVYRLTRLHHLDDLDEDVFTPGVITFVEWADTIVHLLPAERLEVALAHHGEDPSARRITVTARGAAWQQRRATLTAACAPWA